MSGSQIFEATCLGFSLRTPAGWEFAPPFWVLDAARPAGPPWDWIEPNQPFCVARRPHQSPLHAFATLQVTARAMDVPSPERAGMLLDAQLGVLNRIYGDYEVQEAVADATVDGHRAIVIRGAFSVKTQMGEGQAPLHMLNRIHVIFAPGRAFTVGMSSSDDEEYFEESEFAAIRDSIRIRG